VEEGPPPPEDFGLVVLAIRLELVEDVVVVVGVRRIDGALPSGFAVAGIPCSADLDDTLVAGFGGSGLEEFIVLGALIRDVTVEAEVAVAVDADRAVVRGFMGSRLGETILAASFRS
jgi:hypothetical protein